MLKTIWLNIIATSSTKIYQLLLQTISFIITARVLGPDGRGIIVAVLSWVLLFSTLSHLSLGQVLHFRASNMQGDSWFSKTFGALLLIAIVVSFFSFSAALFLYFYSNGEVFGNLPFSVLFIGFLMLPFSIWETYGSNLLIAINKLQKYNKALIIGQTINLVIVIVLTLSNHLNMCTVVVANIFSQIIISSIGFNILWERSGRVWVKDILEVKILLHNGIKQHLNAIGSFLISQSSILMLNNFATKADVGIYQFAYQLINMIAIIPTAALSVFYSRMSSDGVNNFWKQQKKIMIKVFIFLIILSGVGFVTSPYIIPILAGNDFYSSVDIFRWLLIVLFGTSFATMMANQWVGRGLFWQNSLLTIVCGVFNLLLTYYLIPLYGIHGAVWSNIISYGIIVVICNLAMVWWCNRVSIN